MTPTAECQCAGRGTGLGAGRISCHDAGDRLHGSSRSTACSLQQHLQTQNIYKQRVKCMFQSMTEEKFSSAFLLLYRVTV